jgi:hypothetical protein
MRFPAPLKFVLPLLVSGHCLVAQNFLVNGSFERPDGVDNLYDELPPGSAAIPGWVVGPQGGINGIRFYWPASDGRDSVDLHHSVLGPGSIFQDVRLTNGLRYSLSFDMAFNPDVGLPVVLGVSIGSLSNTYTRSTDTPFWQRQSLTFTATNTGLARLAFEEKGLSPTGSPEVAIDNVALDLVLPRLTLRVSQVEVCWNSDSNVQYQVQGRTELSSNTWFAVGEPVLGNGGTNCIIDAVGLNDPRRIYRVVTLP